MSIKASLDRTLYRTPLDSCWVCSEVFLRFFFQAELEDELGMSAAPSGRLCGPEMFGGSDGPSAWTAPILPPR